VQDKRKASVSALPLLVQTDGMTLVGGALPGGSDLLSLYLLLKPERDPDAVLGIAKDSNLLEVERGFRERMKVLDPRGVAAGPTRPHLLARMEELRTKVERAYQSRIESTPQEKVTEYFVEQKLGQGGMAEVFTGRSAEDPTRVVAVKRIHAKYRADEKFAKMFLREARLTRRIQHPNVVRVLSVGKSADDLYLVMEFVEGADLANLLRRSYTAKKRVPIEVACRIIADVCGGLHAAHTAHDASGQIVPILHRDVSPQNVLVSIHGDVKLTDFGVAKAIGSMTESIERTGFVKGKVTYLAPELIDGFPASVRTDVYAAAITLYGCLARLPFKKPDLLQTMRAILSEKMPLLSTARDDAPKRLDEILARATAKAPEERQASAQALQLELEDLLTTLPPADVGSWVKGFRTPEDPSAPPPPVVPTTIMSKDKTSTTRVPIHEEIDPGDSL
jgi:serine/threonine protein kinase